MPRVDGENFMGKLDGKIAVITGGNSGIGLATAQQFVAEGVDIVVDGGMTQV
jgi:NAD(P)-dependent dehydrogenase (short-subunit alcohol dehydrogenase family)